MLRAQTHSRVVQNGYFDPTKCYASEKAQRPINALGTRYAIISVWVFFVVRRVLYHTKPSWNVNKLA